MLQLHVDLVSRRSGLQNAVYDAVRGFILSGELKSGSRLPSSRELAGQLGVSRNTVMLAYERLAGEDLVEGRERSGLFVRRLVGLGLSPQSACSSKPAREIYSNATSLLGLYKYVGTADRLRPLAIGTPALDQFPFAQWGKLARRLLRSSGPALLGYGDPMGDARLRSAISDHIAVARGIRCSPDQVLVCAGAQAGMYLCSLVLCGPGAEAWVEDPGYGGVPRAVAAAGGTPVPVAVDGAGLNPKLGERLAPNARIAFVTPSNQHPTGVAMGADRRLELIAWAERHDSWICEDDYDSEFRFDGRPLTSLYGMALERGGGQRVIYCGSFSKTLFPALKVGYLVLPPELVEMFVAVRAMIGREPPSFEQAVLANFIREGHYGRHLRRIRKLYADRAAALREAVTARFGGRLELAPITGGLQAIARLAANEKVAKWQAAVGEIGAMPEFARVDRDTRDAMIMGFANMTPERIDEVIGGLSRSRHLAR